MNCWMNLPEQYQNGKFVILPISYEKDLTYGTGTSNGPKEIIEASKHLEYYDEEFDNEPFEKGIKLLPILELDTPEEMITTVSNKVQENKNKFIIGLGGDHAVTIGLTKNLDEDTSVIIFDAHADFRDSWNNSTLNHACTAKQISKKHDLALIGVRSMDVDEKNQIENNENVHLIKAHQFSLENIKQILPKLKNKIYISIDVDVFDPSFIRNTGTPEPGGLTWQQVINSLKFIFQNKEVVGADIVEFAPKYNFQAEAYSLAKLVYKIMSMKEKYN